MKKGFTLIELLGVIILVAALSLLVLPNIMNQFQKKKTEISAVTKKMIEEASSVYVENHPTEYPKTNGNVYCISVDQLLQSGNLSDPLLDPSSGEEIPKTHQVKVTTSNRQFFFQFIADGECQAQL